MHEKMSTPIFINFLKEQINKWVKLYWSFLIKIKKLLKKLCWSNLLVEQLLYLGPLRDGVFKMKVHYKTSATYSDFT